MISLLITLIIICCVIGVLIWCVRMLPIPAPFGNIVIVLIVLIALVWLLSQVGGLGFGLHGLR